jgi:hypothetical protein
MTECSFTLMKAYSGGMSHQTHVLYVYGILDVPSMLHGIKCAV